MLLFCDEIFTIKTFWSHFIDNLPHIQNELLGKDLDDYKMIESYASKYKTGSIQEGQLRNFLALSYSHFQLKLDNYKFAEWKWAKWLQQNKDYLSCAVSFNYDLVLERALRSVNISYSRTGSNEPPRNDVSVLKPHGSIDFDFPSGLLPGPYLFGKGGYHTHLNNAGAVKILPKWEWLLLRTEADIIPPSVHNYQKKLRWVQTIFNTYESKSKQLEALIIIGSSYWYVDRPEIDFFSQKLPKKAKVYIMHPKPSEPLTNKIESLGLSWEKFNFDELPW